MDSEKFFRPFGLWHFGPRSPLNRASSYTPSSKKMPNLVTSLFPLSFVLLWIYFQYFHIISIDIVSIHRILLRLLSFQYLFIFKYDGMMSFTYNTFFAGRSVIIVIRLLEGRYLFIVFIPKLLKADGTWLCSFHKFWFFER